MHQRKLVAKPRRKLTPEQQLQSGHYDRCRCNRIKAKISKTCYRCKNINLKTTVSSRPFNVEGEECKRIPLTKGQSTVVLERRYDELNEWNWAAIPRADGKGFYAIRHERGKTIYMHRQIIGGDSDEVDHCNGDTLDNRDSNLRACTSSQNRSNSGVRSKTKSGFKGVYPMPRSKAKPWVSTITHDNKLYTYIGCFSTAEEAARAYDRMAIHYFGEFAHTNFPRSEYA